MFVLVLNDMRASNVENIRPVYRAKTRKKLEEFLEQETVSGYRDGSWHKSFRKGGPLEWMNPPLEGSFSECNFKNVGTQREWEEAARKEYNDQVLWLPEAI